MSEADGWFRSAGARLRFRDEGAGPAIVFVHGWTLDLESWDPQAAALARDFRVIRYDRRGFGRSEGEPARDADVRDLAQLLDHLGLRNGAIVGLSQGARVALTFALAHAERVSALVLDGPPDETGAARSAEPQDFPMAEFRRLAREQGIGAFRSAWRGHALMRLHGADAEAAALLDRILDRYPGLDLLGPAQPPPVPAGQGALASLESPVLIINGEFESPGRLRAGESLAAALSRAERIVIRGAGHLPNLDAPRAYNAAVRAFLEKQSRAAA